MELRIININKTLTKHLLSIFAATYSKVWTLLIKVN